MVAERRIAQLLTEDAIQIFDPGLIRPGAGTVAALPTWFGLAVALLSRLLARRTAPGLLIEATGINECSARLVGVDALYCSSRSIWSPGFARRWPGPPSPPTSEGQRRAVDGTGCHSGRGRWWQFASGRAVFDHRPGAGRDDHPSRHFGHPAAGDAGGPEPCHQGRDHHRAPGDPVAQDETRPLPAARHPTRARAAVRNPLAQPAAARHAHLSARALPPARCGSQPCFPSASSRTG